MKFDIVNDYGALEPAWLERLEEILPLYAEQEGLPDALVIGLTFCDDDAIRAINAEYRGIDRATDVLSFPLYERDDEIELFDDELSPFGDIVLSVPHAIAQAEAKAHGCPVGDVHFHEVGALDAVADVVGVCYALYLLQPEQILASPVHVGSGTVRCAHGIMPVPAPATANLLAGVPIYGGTVRGELCTPTGAALLTHFAQSFGPMPVMTAQTVGVGIGTKTFEQANCVRAFLGETAGGANREILELVCNIDDMTPEALSFACSRLLEEGALDVYVTPGTMKKGRPGHVLTVLCPPDREGEMARHILTETTTNGLRVRRCGKYFLTPGAGQVQTQWGPVRLKLAQGYGIAHAKPEFEDAAALAREHGVPYQEVVKEIFGKL